MNTDPLNGARWRVDHGDCLDVLRGLPDACVDSVVTDPPYGLSSHDRHVPDILRAWLDGGTADDIAGRLRGFMGRSWDALPPSPVVWREVLRVLKPGGHCLSFGGTRTAHLVAIGMQLAGFEIRDSIEVAGLVSSAHLLHVQSQGFPKSLDVSKAIDATLKHGKSNSAGIRRINDTQQVSTSRAGTASLGRDAALTHGYKTEATTSRNGVCPITAPATPDAAAWAGWGTALAPAVEPVIVARKPLSWTVAANVLEYGTGALWIDGCRVRLNGERPPKITHGGGRMAVRVGSDLNPRATPFCRLRGDGGGQTPDAGRWPPNLLLVHSPACNGDCAPDCPVRALGEQSGESKSTTHSRGVGVGYNGGDGIRGVVGPDDTGTAARFFPQHRDPPADGPCRYVPTASRSERERGCEALPARTGAEAVHREAGSAGMDSPRAGAGRTATEVRNIHPTCKPVAVMRWLIRLVTPPGGIVGDFHCGSGTTGVAALAEGMRFLGVEREAEYVDIARARIGATAPRPLGWRYDPAAQRAEQGVLL